MIRTTTQNRQLHMLINRLGLDAEQKKQLVLNASRGRTERSSKLTVDECNGLIGSLRVQLNHPTPQEEKSAANKMRRKMIHLAHLLGWKLPDGRADIDLLNGWCQKFGMFHKPLQDHTTKELPKLVSQFEKVFNSELNKG